MKFAIIALLATSAAAVKITVTPGGASGTGAPKSDSSLLAVNEAVTSPEDDQLFAVGM